MNDTPADVSPVEAEGRFWIRHAAEAQLYSIAPVQLFTPSEGLITTKH